MSAAAEAPFVYAFAGLLVAGSVVLLFIPLLLHVRLYLASRAVLAVVIGGLLAVGAGAVLLVTYAVSSPADFIPVAAVTAVLRLASPTLLYRGIRNRFEGNRAWSGIRLLVAGAFVAFAALLVYNLANVLLGNRPSDVAGLSEQLAMALGASLLIARTGFRFRPRLTVELWPIWIAATVFALAFVVVAPYAFPAFEVVYQVSGLAGWIVGASIVIRVE
ncbi:MAG: hypothetical protein E6K15_05990 [Methanobacteriota archaeon]|nr:MAG: hypothetical protein E6K15_05990 [Euryarchaeota archaeon]